MKQQPILEVCTGSLQSVMNAVAGGARRIELCSALSLDGLTPSIGLLQTVRELYPKLTIHVLIRVRESNFVYTEDELRVMERDITAALPYADAIVGGALTPDGDLDMAATRRLIAAAAGKPFTFHRAFDVCHNRIEALKQLMDMGCDRILTSGGALTAEAGIARIKEYVALSAGRLTILPGGGVKPGNVRHILEATGATEIHGSASGLSANGRTETQTETVRELLRRIG